MANRYLDLAGATYLIGKIKTLLSGYMKTSDMAAITNAEIDAAFA